MEIQEAIAKGLQNRHGAQGRMDGASKSTLENEFGTHNDEEVIKQILEKGTLQETEVRVPHPFPLPPFNFNFNFIAWKVPNTNRPTNRRQRDKAPRTTAWVPELHTRYVGTRAAYVVVNGIDLAGRFAWYARTMAADIERNHES
jgi:hypothetical protein